MYRRPAPGHGRLYVWMWIPKPPARPCQRSRWTGSVRSSVKSLHMSAGDTGGFLASWPAGPAPPAGWVHLDQSAGPQFSSWSETPNGGCTVDGHRRSVFWMPEEYPKNHRTSLLLPDTYRGWTLSRALPFLCCAHSQRGWWWRRDEPRTAGSSRDDPAHVNGLPAAPWSGCGKTRAPGHVPSCGCSCGADGSFAGCRWRQLRGVARRPSGPAPASWPLP